MNPSRRGPVLRERLLRMHAESGLGHVGGNLSCLDILDVLHHEVLGVSDDVVLSKGHAVGALLAVLWSTGRVSDEELVTWCTDGSALPGHPVPQIPGVLFSTGSLGHGLSLSLGLALGRRWCGEDGRVWCVMSEGEWQEGSCWEALMLAVHVGTPNLTAVVDVNGWQGFGSTDEVLSMGDLALRIAGFGASVVEVDGHDTRALGDTMNAQAAQGFSVVLAHTTKGRGTSLQDTLASHYLPLPEVDRP